MLEHIHNSNLIENIDDPDEDAQSCEAWAYLIGHDEITPNLIRETHRLITKNQLKSNEAGQLRTVQVWVGRRYCPPPVVARSQFFDWCLAMEQDWEELDPKEMHVQFEKIHPFIDGNGRTGRMLMWWHEKKLGRKPTKILVTERQKYYKWFK